MKANVLFVTLCFLGILCSCESIENLYSPKSNERGYCIIQISDTKYLENVLACQSSAHYDSYQVCGTGDLYCEDLFLGISPYVHLIDNYYLIDWKWNLSPCSECILLKDSWKDVQSRYNQTWKQKDGYLAVVEDFIDKMYWTSPREIDTYLQITPAPPSKEWWSVNEHTEPKISSDYELPWLPSNSYTSVAELPDTLHIISTKDVYTKEDFLAEINRQDSLQQVYVERLMIVMKETTLSAFASVFFNFREDL